MTALPIHREIPIPPEDLATIPLLSLGFRPFFLLAASAATLLIPTFLWLLWTGPSHGPFTLVDWHAHEMLFGFATAVVAGFLLTAASNWTGERTATGGLLGLLAALWLLGRLVLVIPGIPRALASAVDLAFVPALLVVVAGPLLRARSRRNYVFLAVGAGLFAGNVAFHLNAHDFVRGSSGAKETTLRIFAFLLCVVYGRILPMFTRNATGDANVRALPWLDRSALGCFLAAVLGDALRLPKELSFLLWLTAGLLALGRMATWGTTKVRANLLWVLHAGYGITALSFVAEAFARLSLVPSSTATHLFTIGGIGLSCLGMMTRVSLGHSGRMLVADRRMTFAFLCVLVAAPVRAFGPLLDPSHVRTWLTASGALWSTAFACLVLFGWPIWTSPRLAAKAPYHR